MATTVRPTECFKGHPLWIRNGIDYFCKICGDISIEELEILTNKEIRRLAHKDEV